MICRETLSCNVWDWASWQWVSWVLPRGFPWPTRSLCLQQAVRFRSSEKAGIPGPASRLNSNPEDFQFAIVSDRTGGHRANIFAQAVERLNLMQPEFGGCCRWAI